MGDSNDISIKIQVEETKSPTIYEIGGVPISGKAGVKRALKAEASAQIDQAVDKMFPPKAPAAPMVG